ncbi:MAG: hypothetical protein ACK5LJ_13585 [Paracoccus sp. (in: a-proteobacteria)]
MSLVPLLASLQPADATTFSSPDTLTGDYVNDVGDSVTVSAPIDGGEYNVSNKGDFLISAPNGDLNNVDLLNNDGTLKIEAGASASARTVRNYSSGKMTIGGTLSASSTAGSAIQNESGGEIVMDGGTIDGDLTNYGNATLSGAVTGDVANSGEFSTNGDLTVAAIVNNGTVNINKHQTLTPGDGLFDNRNTLNVEGTLVGTLQNRADAVTNLISKGTVNGDVSNHGTLTGYGTITGTLDNNSLAEIGGEVGAINNNAGATLHTNGNLDVGTAANPGQLINNGEVFIGRDDRLVAIKPVDNRNELTVSGKLIGNLENSGITTVDNGLIKGDVGNTGTLTGMGSIKGTVTNDGLLTIEATDTLAIGGGTVNNADVTVKGTLKTDLSNEAGASTTLSNGTIRGSLTNNSTLTGAGTITGTLTNLANASLSGSLGELANSGTLTATGDLSAKTLTNSGDILVTSGTSLNSTKQPIQNGGDITIGGTVSGGVNNSSGSSVVMINGTLNGSVSNSGSLTGSGTLGGHLQNDNYVKFHGNISFIDNRKTLEIDGRISTGGLTNSGTINVEVGDTLISANTAINTNEMTIGGLFDGALSNENDGELILASGRITGALSNGPDARMTGTATVDGTVTNKGVADIGGHYGVLTNSGSGRLTSNGDLHTAKLINNGDAQIDASDNLISDKAAINRGTLSIKGTLTGDLVSAAGVTRLDGGSIDGHLENRTGATAELVGNVTGTVSNQGGVMILGQTNPSSGRKTGNLVIGGDLHNLATNTSDAADEADPGVKGLMTVANGATVSVGGSTTNEEDATLTLAGKLISDVSNHGIYRQTGTLDGTLWTNGSASVSGDVTGNLIYAGGTLGLGGSAAIDGTLSLLEDYGIADGSVVHAGNTLVNKDVTLSLGGEITGTATNLGTIIVSGSSATVGGKLTNNSLIDLRDGSTDTRLTTRGLAGSGTIMMDVSTGTSLSGDRIIVSGGAVTGSYHLGFSNLSTLNGAVVGQRITLLDVDESQGSANNFTYSYDSLSTASERIVYSVDQANANGNLSLVSQVNPAIGAMFANVTLVQSLIGSVINRPSSPYVTGLVVDYADKPCGIGGWGRGLGGSATVNGKTDNQISTLENEATASYYGMQGGVDLACFDDRYGGWDMAFGILGGVNIGDSRQPIYAIDGNNSASTSSTLSSVTTTDFQQNYGGVYATASKGRWTADLQLRAEKTDFELENTPVVGTGLGIIDPNFSSTGMTMSGSLAYSMPIKDSGWTFSPNAGFSWSKYSTDSIRFEDDFVLEFDDSERQVGFVGASIGKTYVQLEQNSALHGFLTATYYTDFADKPVSRLLNDSLSGYTTQVMTSDNLESYGEFSVGANYVKVLDPGSSRRPRQFSTSARIDSRFGDSIDSVGVTGQIRWQF